MINVDFSTFDIVFDKSEYTRTEGVHQEIFVQMRGKARGNIRIRGQS